MAASKIRCLKLLVLGVLCFLLRRKASPEPQEKYPYTLHPEPSTPNLIKCPKVTPKRKIHRAYMLSPQQALKELGVPSGAERRDRLCDPSTSQQANIFLLGA